MNNIDDYDNKIMDDIVGSMNFFLQPVNNYWSLRYIFIAQSIAALCHLDKTYIDAPALPSVFKKHK